MLHIFWQHSLNIFWIPRERMHCLSKTVQKLKQKLISTHWLEGLFNLGTRGVVGWRHAPTALPPRMTSTHCVGGWVGPGTGLHGSGKSRPTWIRSRIFEPVASRYTDYASPAHLYSQSQLVFRVVFSILNWNALRKLSSTHRPYHS